MSDDYLITAVTDDEVNGKPRRQGHEPYPIHPHSSSFVPNVLDFIQPSPNVVYQRDYINGLNSRLVWFGHLFNGSLSTVDTLSCSIN